MKKMKSKALDIASLSAFSVYQKGKSTQTTEKLESQPERLNAIKNDAVSDKTKKEKNVSGEEKNLVSSVIYGEKLESQPENLKIGKKSEVSDKRKNVSAEEKNLESSVIDSEKLESEPKRLKIVKNVEVSDKRKKGKNVSVEEEILESSVIDSGWCPDFFSAPLQSLDYSKITNYTAACKFLVPKITEKLESQQKRLKIVKNGEVSDKRKKRKNVSVEEKNLESSVMDCEKLESQPEKLKIVKNGEVSDKRKNVSAEEKNLKTSVIDSEKLESQPERLKIGKNGEVFDKRKRKNVSAEENNLESSVIDSEKLESQPERLKIGKNSEVSDKRKNVSGEKTNLQSSVRDSVQTGSNQKCTHVPSNKDSVPCGNFAAEKSFNWMIFPMSSERFFDEFWEKNYAYIPRENEKYWNCLYSCEDFDKILKNHRVEFGKDIDITEYVDGARNTIDAEGIANRNAVWEFYQDNCTIRMKNPQAYHEKLYQLLSHLQEYFGSFMGANMYLTPPASQGFAPHYDDIEAFVLQIEGRKLWKIYAPREENEKLPRFSSPNFTQDEIGAPIFEVELKAGDILYFPRGFIHQAHTVNDSHSLHLTISTYQNNTWGDLMQVMLPQALEIAMATDVEFRESLPKDYMDHVGMAYKNQNTPEREAFFKKIKRLYRKLTNHMPVDEATDVHAKNFIHSSLPPSFVAKEKNNSVYGNSFIWKNGVICMESIKLDTRIRLIRKRIFRMVFEDNSIRLYHSLSNSKQYKENEIKYVEADEELAPAVQFLLHSFPAYIKVDDLPLEMDTDKILFASDMYNNGFLMTETPLQKVRE